MRRLFFLLSTFSLALAEGIEVVEGDGWQYVKVSLTDINRVVCPVDVGSVVFSREKEIEVKTSGRNVYVKFLPRVMPDGKTEISDIQRELYVECGDKVFQLVLVPERIPAKVIVLKLPHVDKEKARQAERANPYEETLLSLIRQVYMEEVPEGYEVKFINKPYKKFTELDMVLYREYEGAKFRVREFILTANMDIELWEGQFVPYLDKPLAIAIVRPILKKGESTRLIVVELNDA
ncbi:MAG: type-F conjugative transfer system secretin TraK [Aquificaceae bacterium]